MASCRRSIVSPSSFALFAPHPQQILLCAELIAIALLAAGINLPALGEEKVVDSDSSPQEWSFERNVEPLLKRYCVRCHGAETMEAGVRFDQLDGRWTQRRFFLWKGILKQVSEETMPPEDEPQLTTDQRRRLGEWIRGEMEKALLQNKEKNGSARRLTVAQYRNTLRDLLKLDEDLTGVLPPDGLSEDGFVNNGQTMQLSPLLVEAYFNIAEKALDLCIVDETTKPVIQNFRMDLGRAINPEPFPEKLILGANSLLLDNADFMVTELARERPFDYEPFRMQTKYRFIEGYQGNDTVRGWRDYDSIYHAVFACMRGSEGYPKGLAYQNVPEGLLLRPAIPSAELFQVESTYGPRANFKISLRELPDHGRFRVTIRAARYDDGLLLDHGTKPQPDSTEGVVMATSLVEPQTVNIRQEGIYQVDVYLMATVPVEPGTQSPPAHPDEERNHLTLTLNDRYFVGQWLQEAFVAVRLPAGPLKVAAQYDGDAAVDRVVFTPLEDHDELAARFKRFETRSPRLGVHVGLRRDCGSTFAPVGIAQAVSSRDLDEFVFEGAINNYPSPDVEENNVNYLAGVREIGVRSEHTDGRDMPRLVIRSVEFEGPLYESWPPATHRAIFIESDNRDAPPVYAREVIRSFASRAFRRPITVAEEASIFAVWERSFAESDDFFDSIKDALLVVLTSPQFLFLIEDSSSPAAEDLDAYELASKLSYFLWNAAPDERLLELARADALHGAIDAEIERMVQDPRFQQFADEFIPQWLSLDKFDVVNVDREMYPALTRDTKAELRKEPIRFVQYLMQRNLPLRNLIQSDFILANDVVSSYYGLGDRTESGFSFVPIYHESDNLGGVLSQAGILAGLSDGRHANPVKRGAWLARKIIAEPPDPPPPNVPELREDDNTLTLREKLERHRNQKGCVNCHAGIDPWGLPFERFDASGRFRKDLRVDARSTLPDHTEVADLNELKSYLANDRIDRVAFSFMKHLASYAVGRSLSFQELVVLEEKGLQLKPRQYRMQDMIQFVVKSDIFLKK